MDLVDKAKVDKAKADKVAMGASAAVTGKPKSGTCTLFNSTSGCSYGSKCRFLHVVPARDSTAWKSIEKYWEAKGAQ